MQAPWQMCVEGLAVQEEIKACCSVVASLKVRDWQVESPRVSECVT